MASGWVVLSGTKGRLLLHSRTFAQYLRLFSSFSVLSVCAYKNYVATGSLDRTIKWENHQFLLSCVLFQHVCVLSDCVSRELLTRKFVFFFTLIRELFYVCFVLVICFFLQNLGCQKWYIASDIPRTYGKRVILYLLGVIKNVNVQLGWLLFIVFATFFVTIVFVVTFTVVVPSFFFFFSLIRMENLTIIFVDLGALPNLLL